MRSFSFQIDFFCFGWLRATTRDCPYEPSYYVGAIRRVALLKKLNLMAMRHLAEATEWVSLAEKIKQEESTQSMASTSKSRRKTFNVVS